MKEIEKTELSVTEWCKNNQITILEGELKNETNVFQLDIGNNVLDFLELGKSNNINIIVTHKKHFSFDDYSWGILKKVRSSDDELRLLIESELAKLPKYEDKICWLTIYWTKEGVIYKSSQQASWIPRFQKKIETIISDYQEQVLKRKQSRFPHSLEIREELTKALASHEDYLRFSSRSKELDALMKNLMIALDIEITDFNLSAAKKIIKPEAYWLFVSEYSQKAIDKLNMQIKAMHKKGYNKSETIAKLNITEGLYNKFK
jgi:hypothetical protein